MRLPDPVLIRSGDPANTIPHVYAEAAWCPHRGKHVARIESRHGYKLIDYDLPARKPLSSGQSYTPPDISDLIRRGYEMRASRDLPSPVDKEEYMRFQAAWPSVSKLLSFPEEPPTLFPIGIATYAIEVFPHVVVSSPWRELVDRHQSGDFGLNGRYSKVALTDELVWMQAGFEDIATRNSFAIATKALPVISRYPCPEQPAQPGKSEWGAKRFEHMVITLPAEPRTHCFLHEC
jgi:hypothetical protein